jgi:hypothetical protein
MKNLGGGVYLFDGWDVDDMPCSPGNLQLEAISGPADVPAFSLEKTATIRLLQFSVNCGQWCGVTNERLLDEVRKRDLHAFAGVNLAIHLMIKEKLVVVSERSKWLGCIDFFSPKIIRPTPMLVRQILAHQKAGRCCGRFLTQV